MNARRWTYIGRVLLGAVALVLAAKPGSPQILSSPPLAAPVQPADPSPVPTLPQRESDGSPRERLKSYEALWTNPDAAKLRAAEEALLQELEGLPPQELVALLGQGLSTRSGNLVLITLENAGRGPRRTEYEDALVAGMEAVFEQPDKLEALAGVTLRFDPSRENAEVAARLLMKRGPAGRLAEYLGGFAARLEGDPREEVKRFAVQHNLIETLGQLVDEGADVARLQGYLADPATRDRAQRALETASASVTNEDLRRQIQGALGQ